jgi:uroporphyrinogen-III decarboxylase
MAVIGSTQSCAVEPPAVSAKPIVDIYMMIGKHSVWFGSTIGYTVYQPTKVEARFLSVSGEIVLVLKEGERQPGQYILPFDGTVNGGSMAGYYTFELYYGDDYAAKLRMVVIPIDQPS